MISDVRSQWDDSTENGEIYTGRYTTENGENKDEEAGIILK